MPIVNSGARGERRGIVGGSGCTVRDAHGTELLDVLGGGNWVAQAGQPLELAERLVRLSPDGLDRVFFTNDGSEGVPYPDLAAELYGEADAADFLLRELATTIDRIGAGDIAAMIREPVTGGAVLVISEQEVAPATEVLFEVVSRLDGDGGLTEESR